MRLRTPSRAKRLTLMGVLLVSVAACPAVSQQAAGPPAAAAAPPSPSGANAPEPEPKLKRRSDDPAQLLNVDGVVAEVHCGPAAAIDLELTVGSKTMDFHAADAARVAITTANFSPTNPIRPCTDLEGMKARVSYQPGADSQSAARLIALRLVE